MNTKDRICDCGAHFVPVENIVFQLDDGATEVLRLDKDGMIYKGEQVLDAGQAYAAFTNWLKQANAASLALQERRQEQRRSKVDNDLAELYARRDKDRRTAAPNAANRIDLEILWAKHKTGNDENARMSKENFFAAMTETAPLKNEDAALRHDNARHVRICAEQATEIVELSSNYKKVYEIALAWFNGDSFALNALIKKGADDE